MTSPAPRRREARAPRPDHLRLVATAPPVPACPAPPEESPAPVEESAKFARYMLNRLSGDLDLPESEFGDGHCGECSRHVPIRYTLGAFELCRRCARRRQAAERLT